MNLPILHAGAHVYIYPEPLSMACGFPRLTEIVDKSHLLTAKDTTKDSGDLFLFVNKKQTYCKILFWSKGGYCILAKKLEKGKFSFDLGEDELSIPQLAKILDVSKKLKKGKV